MALDGYIRRPGVAFDAAPSIGGWWPVVGLLNVASYWPLWASLLAGLSFGLARTLSVWLNDIPFSTLTGSNWLSLLSTGLFGALAAVSTSYLMQRMKQAENEVALARAREDIARTLHDGVLQTLALVERRSHDPDLAQMAREQERELRAFLAGQSNEEASLSLALLKYATRYEKVFGGRVQVLVAEDTPQLSSDANRALAGAVGETLTNAGKHGNAQSVNVYVEPFEETGVFCSVKDDGSGFDVNSVVEGRGLSASVKRRIEEVGGRVEIRSVVGEGVEVLMWIP
jgi:signal transduction histidine kinase